MAFMKEILRRNIPVWDRCAETAFVQDMKKGTLSLEDFKEYMIQDSIYLKNYARIYGKAIYHAKTWREIQMYHFMLNFVNDTESAVRLGYLQQFDITDGEIESVAPLPENRNYMDFLFAVAERGRGCEILMSVLPCMLSYSYIFRKLADDPESEKSGYWDFIQDYADDQYADNCREWFIFAEQKCENLSGAERDEASRIFERASFLELDFWNMVYRRKGAASNEKGA